tara:strand:+ start:412 stop:1629 length:1218 start_codon:yes stop_codon:yes gene_type:complete
MLKLNPKILIVSECFYPEEFKINDVAFQWVKDGYDVDILTLIPSYPKGKIYPKYKNRIFLKENINGVNVYRFWAVLGYKNSKIKKILKYINFMVIGSVFAVLIGKKYQHIFGFNLGALSDMLPAVLIRKIYKKPLTLWVQDIWPDSVYAYGFKKTKSFSFLLNNFVKFIFYNVDNIAISSKGFESSLVNYTKLDTKFHYFPNWADDLNHELKPMILSADKRIHFTFAGNVGKVQNLENIIEAFSLLPKSYLINSQLNIIGDGSHLNFLKSITRENIPIFFHGGVDRDLMAKYYKGSDFLIISLINKPIFALTVPAKLQTYIAAKKPILAIINGETADIVKDNNLGLCSQPEDIASIGEIFKQCINMSTDDKEKFLTNNDELLRNLFDKKKIIDGLLDITTSLQKK